GGVADPGEDDPRLTAARELFEEAGVLLTKAPLDPDRLATGRKDLLAGAPLTDVLAALGAVLELDRLALLSRWITPSAEPRRYAARFYVAQLPAGQEPSFDDRETVDQAWVTP